MALEDVSSKNQCSFGVYSPKFSLEDIPCHPCHQAKHVKRQIKVWNVYAKCKTYRQGASEAHEIHKF